MYLKKEFFFSVDTKNTDDTAYLDPDFFQNLIAGGFQIIMFQVENFWKINCLGGRLFPTREYWTNSK